MGRFQVSHILQALKSTKSLLSLTRPFTAPKTLNPKTLNPKALKPETLNNKPQNPKSLDAIICHESIRTFNLASCNWMAPCGHSAESFGQLGGILRFSYYTHCCSVRFYILLDGIYN